MAKNMNQIVTTSSRYMVIDGASHRKVCNTIVNDIDENKLAFLLSTYCLRTGAKPEDLMVYKQLNQPDTEVLLVRVQEMIRFTDELGRLPNNFTRREKQIGALLSAQPGITNKEIGNRLHISERTVKFHVSALMMKCNVQKRSQLPGDIFVHVKDVLVPVQ